MFQKDTFRLHCCFFQMGGGGRPYEIPDWQKYKVEDAPELVNVRNALAQKGLKDPWLR